MKRKRRNQFGREGVNFERLPGEPFDPPDMHWQRRRGNPLGRLWDWIVVEIPHYTGRRWTISDWTMLAAVVLVLLIMAKLIFG